MTPIPYEDPEEMERLLDHGRWEGPLELRQQKMQKERGEPKRITMFLSKDWEHC